MVGEVTPLRAMEVDVSRPVRVVVTVAMDALVLFAVLTTIGVVVRFFGALSASEVGSGYLRLVDALRLPLVVPNINTPYGGVFDVGGAVTVGVLLAGEWMLAVIRKRV